MTATFTAAPHGSALKVSPTGEYSMSRMPPSMGIISSEVAVTRSMRRTRRSTCCEYSFFAALPYRGTDSSIWTGPARTTSASTFKLSPSAIAMSSAWVDGYGSICMQRAPAKKQVNNAVAETTRGARAIAARETITERQSAPIKKTVGCQRKWLSKMPRANALAARNNGATSNRKGSSTARMRPRTGGTAAVDGEAKEVDTGHSILRAAVL